MPNDSMPAFPIPHVDVDANSPTFKQGCRGMSLRDWLAGQALLGVIQTAKESAAIDAEMEFAEWIAVLAYELADAMLKARDAS